MLKCQSSKAGQARTTKLLTLEPVDICSAPTLICEKYPRKGRMPGNPMSPGIYYEKAIYVKHLKSCVTVIDWLAVSYGFSIETESDETVMGRKTFR